MHNTTEFKINFSGQEHQLNANVLINSLIHTSAIIEQLNKELDTNKHIDTTVKALEHGDIYNIYCNNATIRDTLSANFQTLSEDPSVESFSLLDKENAPLVEVPRADFSDCAVKSDIVNQDEHILLETD